MLDTETELLFTDLLECNLLSRFKKGGFQVEIVFSPLLSLSNRTNILLVHSSAVSGLGLVKAAPTLIL